MTISVAQQAAALAQAAALGLAVGLLYDLFRVLRVRVALPLLGAVLDLSFWIIVTVALFVWSQQAWRGEIRLYGIFFLFGGGVLYFWLISTWMLKIGYFLADAAALVALDLSDGRRLCAVRPGGHCGGVGCLGFPAAVDV